MSAFPYFEEVAEAGGAECLERVGYRAFLLGE
jgi:hypothetical protein